MAVQSTRKTVSFRAELSRSHLAAGDVVRKMLAAVRDALLEKNVAAHIEQSDVDLAMQASELRRDTMSWELHVLRSGDVPNDRSRYER